MGVPNSEVGYNSATAERGVHESSYEHVVALEKKTFLDITSKCRIVALFNKQYRVGAYRNRIPHAQLQGHIICRHQIVDS